MTTTHPPAAADTVTVDEVAAVAQKIGQEIWGEDRFNELMQTAGSPGHTVYTAITPASPSVPAQPHKSRQKKEPA